MVSLAKIEVFGIVQGVGFRPFVYSLARRYGLKGAVHNNGQGVLIEVEGERETLEVFLTKLSAEAPPLSHITKIQTAFADPAGFKDFVIEESQRNRERKTLISPDAGICPPCLKELFDPQDRRYLYPFINCTQCGPRFTIIQDLPYDRPYTTMAGFKMCPQCQAEYDDPGDRRFHAQPNACWDCGPQVELRRQGFGGVLANPSPSLMGGDRGGCHPHPCPPPSRGRELSLGPDSLVGAEAIEQAVELLARGAIVAVKGLGGFHLAVKAEDEEAVRRLRRRKRREEKPLAIMVENLEAVRSFCHLNSEEERLISTPWRPILLLEKEIPSAIAPSVAPYNHYLGVMLPYTPLHYLLFHYAKIMGVKYNAPAFSALVMTSANFSDEPIICTNGEARGQLAEVADAILLHDRDIHQRCDDSVVRVYRRRPAFLRRSRGYVPVPVFLPRPSKVPALGCGAEVKNTLCLLKGENAFLSQHLGDLKNLETLSFFGEAIEHFKRILEIEPQVVGYDLHPDYLSSRYARSLQGVALVGVQHHHAHLVSCLADNGTEGPALGVICDGTGYGTDGKIWGGEFLAGDFKEFQRLGHFRYLPMSGGAAAIKHPSRMAFSYLLQALGPEAQALAPRLLPTLSESDLTILEKMITRKINSPETSSLGRLFDAVSALLGIQPDVTFEGQAAMGLEMLAERDIAESYPYDITEVGAGLKPDPTIIDTAPLVKALVADILESKDTGYIAGKFHTTIARLMVEMSLRLSQLTGLKQVALSGGVFQNLLLLDKVVKGLEQANLEPLIHRQIPPNDGGIALGQALIAANITDVKVSMKDEV
jgi:hydrogenase maturation protein HypF